MLSPRERSAISSPPVWAGVASPSIIILNANSACIRVRGPSAAAEIRGFNASLILVPLCNQESFGVFYAHVQMQYFRGEIDTHELVTFYVVDP